MIVSIVARTFVLSWMCVSIALASCAAQESDQRPLTGLAVTSDGHFVLETVHNELRVRHWPSLQMKQTLTLPCRHVYDVALSMDQTLLAVAGGNPGEFAWVGLYAWPALNLVWSKEFSDDVAYQIAFQSDSTLLAVACHNHSVVLLDSSTSAVKSVLTGHSRPVTGTLFVPFPGNSNSLAATVRADAAREDSVGRQNTMLLSCGIDQTIRVWDISTSQVIRSLTNHTQPVTSMAFRPNTTDSASIVATGSEDRTVRLWQPGIGRLMRFKRLASKVTSLAWTVDGSQVLAGCQDGSVNIINAETLVHSEHKSTSAAWITVLAVHPSEPFALIGDSNGSLNKLSLATPDL